VYYTVATREGDSTVGHFRGFSDISFVVIVTLISVLLLKVLVIPNPFDVIILGGLILVLILTTRK